MSTDYELIVMGASSGGLAAYSTIVKSLPHDFAVPIILCQHMEPTAESLLAELLGKLTSATVKEAEDKEEIRRGFIYTSPPGYHTLIEVDKTFSLSVDDAINYSRPSIDILFTTAAEVYRDKLIGVLLTGANDDGADGVFEIEHRGGVVIIQDPQTAYAPIMPTAGLSRVKYPQVYGLEKIVSVLWLLD